MSADLTIPRNCFYCRRGMHDSCVSGERPCTCCDPGAAS